MRMTVLADYRFQIDVSTRLRHKPRIERRRWLPPSLPDLIGFKRTLDDIGDRAVFSSGETVSQVSSLGASDRELWFSHIDLHFPAI